MCQDRLSSTLDTLVMHYWFIAKILKFVSNLCIKHSWWTVILTMAFPGTSILIGFPELMQKWWQLSQCWVSSHFILPKLWQPWVTFTNGLLFMVGITMFQSNLFPCRHFFLKFYQNLLQLPECFTHVTMSSTLCVLEKWFEKHRNRPKAEMCILHCT